MQPKAILIESIRSGTIASLAIVPLSPLFKAAGLRIGHYGPKFAGLFVNDPQPWMLFVQHIVIGWVSALPLLLILLGTGARQRPVLSGAIYGVAYYVAINSLSLPLYFNDPLPWQLGAATVLPSLIGHVIFGAVIGWTSRRFASAANSRQVPG
ncbi:DUF6789 family protein [Hydrogenophaga sp.]|uniref:DUF6789 family protein n=1 Tax=Hydrogenophaga sp. TaxID=1904254 RepID=UPI0025B7F9B7|nr:DUF6789 family protein [Hydrogenophaga sp.]MBT9465237.1 hypothetical protein [Hydrogenophaga sp.]